MTNQSLKPTVLFINPPGPKKLYRSMVCTFVSKANYIWQPQDFLTLSAHIRPGYGVELLDCCAQDLGPGSLFKKIREADPALLVIAVSSVVFDSDLDFLKRIRLEFPGLRGLVLGDVLLDGYFWKPVCDSGFDLVLNPMDVDLAGYIETGLTSSSNIILQHTDPLPADRRDKSDKPKKVSIGIPRHDVFVSRKYRFPFMKSFLYTTVSTQFGCPYGCSYCSWSKIPVVYRGYQEVIEELESIKRLGLRDIFFGDPSFGFPRENAARLLDAMIGNKFNFRWACYANPGLCDKETLKMMARSGCHTAIIGVEDEDFGMLNSRFQRRCSREAFFEFVKECKGLGIRVCGDFIIGLNDSPQAAERLADLAIRLKLDFASFNIYTPLLGSVIRDRMVAEGRISRGETGRDTSGTFIRGNSGLLKERDQLIRRFYLRPGYLLRRVLNTTTLPELSIQFREMLGLMRNSLSRKNRDVSIF